MLNPRVRLTVLAGSLLVLLGFLGFLLVSDPGSEPAPQVTSGFAGAIRPAAPPVDLALRDQDGRLVQVADARGGPAIVTFMYTTCEDDCPTMTAQIRGALDELGSDVPVYAISVDPANDTPARARRFLAEQRMTGRMDFLLGSEDELQRVWRTFGIQPQEDGREHSASVVLLGSDGRQRVGFPVDQLTPDGLARDLRTLAAE
jgi:protein SCO1/2